MNIDKDNCETMQWADQVKECDLILQSILFVDVAAHVTSLTLYLRSETDKDAGIRTMKRSLLASVETRLLSKTGGLNVLTDLRYVIPTVMDPR